MRVLTLFAALALLAGCPGPSPDPTDAGGGGDTGIVDGGTPRDAPGDAPGGAPPFRNPVDLPDDLLATQALGIMGSGSTLVCSECHGLTRSRLMDWHALSMAQYEACFTDLAISSQASALSMIECMRGGSSTGDYDPAHIGIFATAGGLPWFRYLFQTAYGEPNWRAEYDDFLMNAAMPPSPRTGFSQTSFDSVAEWFFRGMPHLEDYVMPMPPGSCTPSITPDVATYLDARATSNWRATNASRGLLSYDCAGATDALGCLASEPLASGTTFGANWDDVPDVTGSAMRVLFETTYASSYWTRSSADGRFVGHGGGTGGATIIDLMTNRTIAVEASYDPGFFPDNSGFMILGGGGICEQSVLTTGSPTRITFAEPGCTGSGMVGLYEHLGASLAGGDYFAVHGQFVSDNGGHGATFGDPAANFTPETRTRLTRLVNSGSGFDTVETTSFATPSEGDAVISPSSGLVITRLAGATGHIGFVLRRVDSGSTGGTWTVDAPEIARYCVTGGKPAFSYDERWLVYHHYLSNTDADAMELGFTGAADPGYADYRTMGAANLYLMDLYTGTSVRITNMDPGQYALFPHFRSDGWIYFLVRTPGSGGEIVAASNAALLLE